MKLTPGRALFISLLLGCIGLAAGLIGACQSTPDAEILPATPYLPNIVQDVDYCPGPPACNSIQPTYTPEPTLTCLPTPTCPEPTPYPTGTPYPTQPPFDGEPTPTNTPTVPTPTGTVPAPTDTPTPGAATYYVSPGDDLSAAVASLSPGDTLILRDGAYYSPMRVAVAGTTAQPIVIRAEHDGKAVVDGEMVRQPLNVSGTARHIIIEGIRFQSSNVSTVAVYGRNITLRRVSGYISGDGNVHVFVVGYTQDVLLEDCAASGKGRNLYLIYESENVTLRRCWGWWMARNGTGDANNFSQFYGSDDCLIENCVGAISPNPSVDNINPISYWVASWNDTDSCNNNVLEGSVFYDLQWHGIWMGQYPAKAQQNNVLRNSVLIGTGLTTIFQRGGYNFLIENNTLVNQDMAWSTFRIDDQAGVGSSAVLRNNSFVGGTALNIGSGTSALREHNNYYVDSIGAIAEPNATFDNPDHDTTRYGLGAYLIQTLDSQGAEILYAADGSRLWPWPMEARICAETANILGEGISVTYESSQVQYDDDGDGQPETYNCTGGIWKTLQGVYGDTPVAPTPVPVPTEIVVDDSDPGFHVTSLQDPWLEWGQVGGEHYGYTHRYNERAGEGQDTATWSFTVPRPGLYDVYAWWWDGTSRPPNAPYTVNYSGGSALVRVDQRANGGQWNLLGNFYFEGNGSVTVSDDVSSGWDVVADAIRLVWNPEPGPPPTPSATPTSPSSPLPTPTSPTSPLAVP